jgi:hypothetical protein
MENTELTESIYMVDNSDNEKSLVWMVTQTTMMSEWKFSGLVRKCDNGETKTDFIKLCFKGVQH